MRLGTQRAIVDAAIRAGGYEPADDYRVHQTPPANLAPRLLSLARDAARRGRRGPATVAVLEAYERSTRREFAHALARRLTGGNEA